MTDKNLTQEATVLERIIEAPPGLIWQMWTDPQHFSAWYGPEGATVSVATMEVRVGGTRLVGMQAATPQGTMTMWFTGAYTEVVVNKRLAYTESMSDENGNVMSPSDLGMPVGHPTTTEVILELTDLGGRTSITLTHLGVPADSPGTMGWKMALDKLAAYIPAADAFRR